MTLDRYILRQLALSTLFSVAALTAVVLPAIAVNAVHKLGGVGLGAVAAYIPLVAVGLLPYLASLGFLLAVVSVYGRLASDNEWLALTMAGVHPWRTLVPGLILAAVLGSGTYVLLAEISPRWKQEQSAFRNEALLQAFRTLAPGRTEIDLGRFYVGSVRRDGPAFVDAQIRIPGEGGEDLVLVADRAELVFEDDRLVLDLERMSSVKGAHLYFSDHIQFGVPLEELIRRSPSNPLRPSHRTSAAMREDLAAGTALDRWVLPYEFEIHQRRAIGATYLVFLLLGVPTGLWLRSGTQLVGLGAAALYAFAYYVLSLRLGSELSNTGLVSPSVAAWTTNGIGLAVAVLLLLRVRRG